MNANSRFLVLLLALMTLISASIAAESVSTFTSVLTGTLTNAPQGSVSVLCNSKTTVSESPLSSFPSSAISQSLPPNRPLPIPQRDDPLEDSIVYDSGEPIAPITLTQYWCRSSFLAQDIFTLQRISLMIKDVGYSNAACNVRVYSENPQNRNLDQLLWQTSLEELPEWNNAELNANWLAIDIPENEAPAFDQGERFSICYGPTPGGPFNGDYPYPVRYDLENGRNGGPVVGNMWSREQSGQSTATLSNAQAHSGNLSLLFSDATAGDNNYCLYWLNIGNTTHGRSEFWVFLENDGDFGMRAYSAQTELEATVQFNDDGEILVNNRGNFNGVNTEWEAGRWMKVELEFNMEDEVWSAWIDGERIVNGNSTLNGNAINRFLFICYANVTCDGAYLDDIAVDVDTERNDPYGWWSLRDEATEAHNSYILDNQDISTNHAAWTVMEGDLLVRAIGDFRQPEIEISSQDLDFGIVNLPTQAANERELTVRNSGDAVLTISNSELTGQYFTVVNNDLNRINPGEQSVVRLALLPERAGEFQGRFTISSDDADEADVIVQLHGIGNNSPVVRRQIDAVGLQEDCGVTDIVDLDDIFTDPDNNRLEYTFEDAPQQLRLGIDAQFNVLTMNPTEDYNLPNGQDITIVATDVPHRAMARASFRVTISPVADAPRIRNAIPDLTIAEDADPRRTNIIDLDDVASDPDGDAVSFRLGENIPAQLHAELSRFNILSITPEDNFNIPSGIVITTIADDGTGRTTAIPCRLTISSVNDFPTAFQLLDPADRSNRHDSPEIVFTWQSSSDPVEDSTVTYSIRLTFGGGDNWICGLIEPRIALSRNDLSLQPNQPTEIDWQVWANDKVDSICCASTFHVTIAPLDVGDESTGLPKELALAGIYPNPFNASTNIRYELPTASQVTITIYDLNGSRVIDLVSGQVSAGHHQVTWQGLNAQGGQVSSGLYWCRLSTPTGVRLNPIMYLK